MSSALYLFAVFVGGFYLSTPRNIEMLASDFAMIVESVSYCALKEK